MGNLAAKMAVYYKKYKKIFPGPANSRDLHVKWLFYRFLSYRHHPCNIPVMQLMHHSEFNIFKMAVRMVAEKFTNSWKPHLTCRHVWWIYNISKFSPDGEALYKHVYPHKWTQYACLIELHCTSRHIWDWLRISKHVWCNGTSIRVAPDL